MLLPLWSSSVIILNQYPLASYLIFYKGTVNVEVQVLDRVT